MWPFKKKSAFNCSFYKKPEIKKEMPKVEKEPLYNTVKVERKPMYKEIVVARGSGDKYAERMTNRNFGIRIKLNEETDHAILDPDQMQVALLMDIRTRLDKQLEQHDRIIALLEKQSQVMGPSIITPNAEQINGKWYFKQKEKPSNE